MPILKLKCQSCGHLYEALKSFSTSDPGLENCPECNSADLEKQVADSFGFQCVNVNLMSAEEIDNYRHVQSETEKHAAELLSGEMGMVEAGPKEFRPRVPDHLKKNYY